MEKKNLIIIIVLVVIVAGVVGFGVFYYGNRQGYTKGYNAGFEEGKKVGRAAAKIEAGEAVSNPMENMPSTNPFDKVINPYEEAYKNPFE